MRTILIPILLAASALSCSQDVTRQSQESRPELATTTAPDAQIVGNYTSSTDHLLPSQTCRFMAFPLGTYAWYRMNSGTTVWKPIGTTREVLQKTGSANFKLKLVVKTSGGSDTDILALEVSPKGVLCDGY